MKKNSFVLFLLLPLLYFSQSGEKIYPFLNIPVSPRQAALGGDAISIRDYDVNFSAINPALLNLEQDKRLSLNFANYLADSKYGTLNYVKSFENGHLISFNARYIDFGSIQKTDESSTILGDFKANDVSVGMGYAYQFHEDFTLGGNLNYISSKIDTFTSMAVAGSVGISFHNEKSAETASLVFRNFGYQFKTHDGTRERLPFRVDLGYTKILDKFPLSFTITAHDLQQLNISSPYNNNNGAETKTPRKILDHISFGAELFPDQAFNLRLGYNVKRGNELAVQDQRSFSGLSAGFGLRFSGFRFDYAHVRYHNSSNLNLIGISLDFYEITGKSR